MKKTYLLLALSLVLFSCDKEKDDPEPVICLEDQHVDFSQIRMCTEMPFFNDTIDPKDSLPQLRAYMESGKRWRDPGAYSSSKNPSIVISIKFLNGDSYLQSKVKQYAEQWLTPDCLIKYNWVPTNVNADVKIAFKWGGDVGSWSYVGTDCKNIAQNKPSMNFGWFDSSTSEMEFSRVVLHEFGHALGFVHEHQHPLAKIPWDKPKVYAYYATASKWSKDDVDRYVFKLYPDLTPKGGGRSPGSPGGYSNYDKTSIMHYAVDKSLTIGGYSVPWNYYLSETDKQVFKDYYFVYNTRTQR